VRQFFVRHETPVTLDPLPIGHPVIDMEVSVLDDQGQPAPPGTTGEIAVCSEHLAVGYWNRPEMTARAFRVDPDHPTRRLYRTGDLGRMTADGCLQHLGRKDALIKIRGLPVAPAEVEAALCRLPTIQAAVVVANPDRRGAARLVAYFVPRPGASVTVSAVRRQLRALLVPQMIPSAYVALPCLPLNENRKLDRRALPDRPRGRPSLDHPYVAPRYPAEMQLAHAWEELLEVAPVGIRDDFFDLGGDSLLAAAMIAGVEDLTGVPLPASTLTAEATIEQLAQRLAGCRPQAAPVVGLHLDGRKPPFHFLHGDYVHGGLFCRQIAHHLGPDQPCLLVTPCGLDGHPPPGAIEDMAEQHLRAVRAWQPHGPYRLGGNCNGGLVALEMARRLTESGERVHRLIVFRASARNVRFAPLRQWVAPGGALLRLPGPRRRALIRHLRWFLEAWAPLPATGRSWLLLSKVSRLLRPRWRNDRQASGGSLQAGMGRPTLADLTQTYMDAVADYIPMAYDGTVTLLWPEREAELESAAEALVWWRRVSPHTVLDVVPGDHLTALTVHAPAFAQRLQKWLAPGPGEALEAGAARQDGLRLPPPGRRDHESAGIQPVPG
jgi:hypothetical protein